MICKYCGKEIDTHEGICPACKYKRAHPTDSNSVDIYSSSGAAEKDKTFHIESMYREDFAEEVVVLNPQTEPARRKLS